MATAADFNFGGWYEQSTTPIYDGNSPLESNTPVGDYAPSSDSRLIYVSDSIGNDGTGTETTIAAQTDAFDPQGTVLPYKTITAAKARLRDGYPDWILLLRGDSFTGQNFGYLNTGGRSITEPLLLTYYGTSGDRPVIQTGTGQGLAVSLFESHITVFGLDFYAHTRDPSNPSYVAGGGGGNGVAFIGEGSNYVVDDCVIRFHRVNLVCQGWVSGGTGTITNFTVKRSIILDAYSYHSVSHSEGMFISRTSGFLMEDNVLDHNGWNEDDPLSTETQFNHNCYCQTTNTGSKVAQNNVFTNGSAYGLHMRQGGLTDNNLFIGNSQGLGVGYETGTPSLVGTWIRNVILEGKLQASGSGTTAAVWGMKIATSDPIDNNGDVVLQDNIVAHINADPAVASEMGITSGYTNVTYTGNIVHDWRVGEDDTDTGWLDPERSIETYMTSLGETGTFAAYLTEVRNRPLGEWDTRFEATSVNNYIREGFNK